MLTATNARTPDVERLARHSRRAPARGRSGRDTVTSIACHDGCAGRPRRHVAEQVLKPQLLRDLLHRRVRASPGRARRTNGRRSPPRARRTPAAAPRRPRPDRPARRARGARGRPDPPPSCRCSDRCRPTTAPARGGRAPAGSRRARRASRRIAASCPTRRGDRSRRAPPRDRSTAARRRRCRRRSRHHHLSPARSAPISVRAADLATPSRLSLPPMLKLRSRPIATDSGNSPAAKAEMAWRDAVLGD